MAQFLQQHRRNRITAALLVQPIPIYVDPLLAIRRLNRIGARRRSHHLGALDTDRQGQASGLQRVITAELPQERVNGLKTGSLCCGLQGWASEAIDRLTRTREDLKQQRPSLGIGRQGSQAIQHHLLRRQPQRLGGPFEPLQLTAEGEGGSLGGSGGRRSPPIKKRAQGFGTLASPGVRPEGWLVSGGWLPIAMH